MAEAFAVHAKGFGHFQALRCRRSRSENSAFTNSGIIRGKGLFNGAVSASLPQTLRTAICVIGLFVLLAACAATPDNAVPQAGAPGAAPEAEQQPEAEDTGNESCRDSECREGHTR